MNINKALGMVERPLHDRDEVAERRRAIDDWRKLDDTNNAIKAELRERLAKAECDLKVSNAKLTVTTNERDGLMRQIVSIGKKLDETREEVSNLNEICDDIRDTFGYSRDDMVDLTTYVAQDYADLKQQLADVTRERDERPLPSELANCKSMFRRSQRECGELEADRDALREQLDTVQRVLVESLNLTEVGNEFAPPCVDVENAMGLAAAADVAIDTLKLSAEKHNLDADEANKALATVQAEAAAMRRILAENESRLNDVIRRIGVCVDTGWITHELRHVLQEYSTTAGRELLDKMKRNSERIRELENVRKLSSEAYEKISNSHADLKRQLAEHKRDAELCRELRAFLQEQMEILRGCVVAQKWVGSDTLTAQLNDLLVAVREGGAK